MKTQGKFVAKVTINGKSRDASGNIIDRDTHGLPAIWLSVMAGEIPNRQTITGSVAKRSLNIPMDSNGIIGGGEKSGNADSFRIIYGKFQLTGEDKDYGPQYTWETLKDLTNSSPIEVDELCERIGEPNVFLLPKANLPEGYQRKTIQHVSPRQLDPSYKSVNGQPSNVVEEARRDVGNVASDQKGNPEVTVVGNQATSVITD